MKRSAFLFVASVLALATLVIAGEARAASVRYASNGCAELPVSAPNGIVSLRVMVPAGGMVHFHEMHGAVDVGEFATITGGMARTINIPITNSRVCMSSEGVAVVDIDVIGFTESPK